MTGRKTRGTTRKKGQETNYGKSYLSKDFFAPNIDVDTSKLFPMLVVATMSSGKSTLINALLGQQILPSKNAACTAKCIPFWMMTQTMIPNYILRIRMD